MSHLPPLKSRAALRYEGSRFFAEINGLVQWDFSGGMDNLANR